MSDLMSILRAVVRDELKSLRLGDLAVVTAIAPHSGDSDENNHQCDVKLREGELELKKVPIATPHVGMVSPPAAGDLVLLSYVGGDPNRPVVVGRLYTDEARPPVHEAGEWRVESPPEGTSIAIDKDGSFVVTAGKTVLTVKKDGAVTLQGEEDLKLEVKGNVQLKCGDCKVDASGNVELGSGGSGVITEQSHKCYFSGAPLVGSKTVKAKG
ncbi:MAG TPA: phage baseplate assembly protein V [Myxococcales bacterium]|nr:phage baseplate assembly protein V [Myxococcales bacterium]